MTRFDDPNRSTHWPTWTAALFVVGLAATVLIVQTGRQRDVSVELVNLLVSPTGDLDVLVLLHNRHDVMVDSITCDLTFYDEQGEAITGIRSRGLSTDQALPAEASRPTIFYLGTIPGSIETMEGTCTGYR